MPMIPSNAKVLEASIKGYMKSFPGDTICALQVYYEGLGGQGAPNPDEMDSIQKVLTKLPGLKDIGKVRYEKFGMQHSFRCKK